MSTTNENPEDLISKDTSDINSEDSSALPSPPQTPKTNYTTSENDDSNEGLTEEEIKPLVTFKHINVSVHDEINDIKTNLDDDSSEEDENDEEDDESNEEYEDINIAEEFNENQQNNSEDITSTTSLLSISKENNENNEDVPMPNSTVPLVPSSEPAPIPIIDESFENSNEMSFGSLITQNGENVSYTYSDSTLNSGDSTLIQHSSVSSYLDKEDDEMSESSIYFRKFKIYTASASQPKNPRVVGTLPPICKEDCGEDAYFVLDQPNFSALGIADGVGGWTFLGYDPSLFAWDLMNCCKECATTNTWPDPQDILVGGYNKVVEKNEIEAGSSTACILTLDKTTGTVYSSNIGDSGFIVIRNGKVAYQTHELQHYFNAPYQLSVLPDEMKNDPINIMDSPNDAIIDQCTVEEGDVIVLGTDGLWDNIFNEEIITKLASSIEKIDDIQKEIKQINEELYQQHQKRKQNIEENDEKTELMKFNESKQKNEKEEKIEENDKMNKDEIENILKENDKVKKDNNNEKDEINKNEKNKRDDVEGNELKEDKVKDNKMKEDQPLNNDTYSMENVIKRKEELNSECNRILKEITVKLTLDTREMSRNFDKVSPFSYNAKKCGIIHYGG